MAEWNDNVKHPKSSINNGQQYTKDDNVTLESLNNTIENSFYAVRVAENAQSATNNAVSYNAQTPLATEQIQAQKNLGIDQTITFAESERQKSKNLLSFPYYDAYSKTVNGITFTVNENGSIHIEGTATYNAFFYFINRNTFLHLTNDVYSFSIRDVNGQIVDNINIEMWKKYDNSTLRNGKGFITTTFANSDYDEVYIYVSTGTTCNLDIYPQLELGSITDYQPPNGGIVYKKDIEPVLIYDIDTKNTIGGTAYRAGLNGNVTQVISSDIKRLRFYCQCGYGGPIDTGGTSNVFELSLDNRQNSYAQAMYVVPKRSGNNYLTSGLIAVGLEQSTSGDLGVHFAVNDVLVTGADYYCYRIEGIK